MSFFSALTRWTTPTPPMTAVPTYPVLTLLVGGSYATRRHWAQQYQRRQMTHGRVVVLLSTAILTETTARLIQPGMLHVMLKAHLKMFIQLGHLDFILLDGTSTAADREYWCDSLWVRRFRYFGIPEDTLSPTATEVAVQYDLSLPTTVEPPQYHMLDLATHEALIYQQPSGVAELTLGALWAREGYLPLSSTH